MRDDEFMFGSCSDHGRIGRALELALQPFSENFALILECTFAWQAQYLVRLEGVMPVAPRIVNDVPYVAQINHESHFAWQAQYLVRLEGDACCSAHWK